MKILTFSEIEEKYEGEWVILLEPELDEKTQIIKGKLIFHNGDRDKVYKKAMEIKDKHIAVFCAGEIPADLEVMF